MFSMYSVSLSINQHELNSSLSPLHSQFQARNKNLQRLKADSSTLLQISFPRFFFFFEKNLVSSIKISTLYINMQLLILLKTWPTGLLSSMGEVEERVLPVLCWEGPVLLRVQHGNIDLVSFLLPPGAMSCENQTTSYLKIKITFVLINFNFEAFNPEPRTHYFLVLFLDDIKYLVDAYDISSSTERIQLKYFSALNL